MSTAVSALSHYFAWVRFDTDTGVRNKSQKVEEKGGGEIIEKITDFILGCSQNFAHSSL
jgi:hypothetical protein